MQANRIAAEENGKAVEKVPETVRALTDTEKSIHDRRRAEVQRTRDAMMAAVGVYQEIVTLLTGGDPTLDVDVQRGVIVRKPVNG